MKLIIGTVLFIVIADGSSKWSTFLDLQLNDNWQLYKMAYNKTYSTPYEEQERRVIWEDNLRQIQKHNLEYDLGLHSYAMGVNQFSDMGFDEFRSIYLTNTFPTNKEGHTYLPPLNGGQLPTSVDWRKQGFVTPVKNQGTHCGSCWAFSATGSLEGQHYRKNRHLMSLSEQQLVDCSKENYGCKGGYQERAFQYIKNSGGIETEKDYPYKYKEGACRFNKSKVVATCTGYNKILPNEIALANALSNIGPISATIHVDDSFRQYKNGIFENPSCDSSNLNHAVLVVGYGISNNQKEYWIVKNSWGTNWGQQGYIWMVKNKNNNCGIASSTSFPTV